MKKVLALACSLVAAFALSSRAEANDIPVYIYWSGVAPTKVYISTPGGTEPLKQAGPVFHGTITVLAGVPDRRTITLQFDNYNYAFDIRALPFLPNVSLTVQHKPQRSCTRARVKDASTPSDNLIDATKRAVNARELYNILEPNACDKTLKFLAIQAEVRQNRAMNSSSHGLILLNRDLAEAYKAAIRNRPAAQLELASLEQREKESEVKQLQFLKSDAKDNYDFDLAIEINNYMLDRINSDRSIAKLYSDAGVTKNELMHDAVLLTNQRPSAIGSPMHMGERGEK